MRPTCPQYQDYGGRGITVCEEWRNSYPAFRDWALANGYREGLSIDRIDNKDGGEYSPTNCRFVTQKQNNRNRRSNRPITAFGETKLIIEWAEDSRCVVRYATLRQRLNDGLQPENAITQVPANRVKVREAKVRPQDRLTCGYGHLWTEENTYRVSSNGTRQCRQCRVRLDRERRLRKRLRKSASQHLGASG